MARLDDILDPIAKSLTGTKAEPATEPDPQVILDHIKEISQTARGSWFALLALLAFVGVTMMAHTDAAFFAAGAATELPIVGIAVPTLSFFIAAPLLMAALYAHLQLYLIALWDALGDAPERIGADRLIDRVTPTVISQSAVLYRARARRDESAAVRAFSGAMEAITLLLVWFATPALIASMFWRSMALHSLGLTLWTGACLVAACLFGYEGLRVARGRLSRPKEERASVHAGWGRGRRLAAFAFAALLASFSWKMIEGTPVLPWTHTGKPVLYSADLREAELTPRPADWRPFELWLADHRRKNGGDPEQDPLIPTDAEMARYRLMIAALDAPGLRERGLRDADLLAAYLPGADLRRAQMQGANLRWAQMQGADLFGAQMQGADLRGAQMQGAVLGLAQMQGANLFEAEMQGADLFGAQMEGADLFGAQMQGADLFGAQMQEANLRGARMQDADCRRATFQAALLQSADVTCNNLTQAQLDGAVGDEDTLLPDGLTVSSCLETLPDGVAEALAHHPEEGDGLRVSRAQVEDALLCDRDADGNLIEQPRRVGRWPSQGE